MTKIQEYISFFSDLKFEFKGELMSLPFENITFQLEKGLILWECKSINNFVPNLVDSKIVELEDLIKGIKDKTYKKLDDIEFEEILRLKAKCETLLNSFQHVKNPNYDFIKDPYGKFLTKREGDKGVYWFQTTFSEEEIYNYPKISIGLDTHAEEYITTFLYPIKLKIENLLEELKVYVGLKNNNKVVIVNKVANKKVEDLTYNTTFYNFSSKSFETSLVVNELFEGLKSNGLIKPDKVGFNSIFNYKPIGEPVKRKLVWLSNIGLCRYFILKLDEYFDFNEIPEFKSQKYYIADSCIQIQGKNVTLSNEGSNGKYGSKTKQQIIDNILMQAKDALQSSDGRN